LRAPQTTTRHTSSATLTTLHGFLGGTDGADPAGKLVNVGGTLYGTTIDGGGSTGCAGGHGCGTAFAINPTTGAERVIHVFAGNGGSAFPNGLIGVNSLLYGTSAVGGGDDGTAFRIDPAGGTEEGLHLFTGSPDGNDPQSALVNVAGTFYGTTAAGGKGTGCSRGCGTVYKLVAAKRTETVVYSFLGGKDGEDPQAALLNVGGTLYGTTASGGGTGCGGSGCGTVFALNPTTGAEIVLHSFAGGTDGSTPDAELVNIGGTVYGTTYLGGGTGNGGNGFGTVFALNPSTGAETVVHSFAGAPDGALPRAALVNVSGTLYGTTFSGGSGTACSIHGVAGCGTVFTINSATGVETVVYSFTGGTDGADPQAPLIDIDGLLYGTALNGGTLGYGTVFKLTP
jgi:uncharacterized repeat protein (TIGR03803 family)